MTIEMDFEPSELSLLRDKRDGSLYWVFSGRWQTYESERYNSVQEALTALEEGTLRWKYTYEVIWQKGAGIR